MCREICYKDSFLILIRLSYSLYAKKGDRERFMTNSEAPKNIKIPLHCLHRKRFYIKIKHRLCLQNKLMSIWDHRSSVPHNAQALGAFHDRDNQVLGACHVWVAHYGTGGELMEWNDDRFKSKWFFLINTASAWFSFSTFPPGQNNSPSIDTFQESAHKGTPEHPDGLRIQQEIRATVEGTNETSCYNCVNWVEELI